MKRLLKLFCIGLILFVYGCTTPAPPLTESEIPWRMKPGSYRDDRGAIHLVQEVKPRWYVSEAYLLEAVTDADKEQKDNYWLKTREFTKEHWFELLILLGLLIGAIKHSKLEPK